MVEVGVLCGLVAWSLLTAPAFGGTYYLESSASTSRDEAVAVGQALAAEGLDGEILRVYVRETGWRYVFRSEDRHQESDLTQALAAWTDRSLPVHLVVVSDGRASIVRSSVVDTSSLAAVPPAAPPVRTAPSTVPAAVATAQPSETVMGQDVAYDAQEILRRVSRAHAGPSPAGGLGQTRNLVFRFARTLPGLHVEHVYARRGDDVYVAVDVLEGEGLSSKAGIVKERAWSDVPTAPALDALFVRSVLKRFSPDRVLGVAALLTAGVPQGREYDQMSVGETVRFGGRAAVTLQFRGDREASARSLIVDVGTWRVVEMVDEDVRWRFFDYVELGDGSIYPRRAEAWRDRALVDAIDVVDLDRQPVLPAEWFPTAAR